MVGSAEIGLCSSWTATGDGFALSRTRTLGPRWLHAAGQLSVGASKGFPVPSLDRRGVDPCDAFSQVWRPLAPRQDGVALVQQDLPKRGGTLVCMPQIVEHSREGAGELPPASQSVSLCSAI